MKTHVLSVCSGLLILVVSLLSSGAALAHNVRVFAWAEGNEIVGETAFSGGRPAKNATIVVRARGSDTVLATTRTDGQGRFRFPIPRAARREKPQLVIVLAAGQGHQGEWVLDAADYLPGEEEAKSGAVAGDSGAAARAKTGSAGEGPESAAPASLALDRAGLEALVSRSVEIQLRPVKRMLVESENREPDLRDVLGGIGYLIGMAGILFYCRARLILAREKTSKDEGGKRCVS